MMNKRAEFRPQTRLPYLPPQLTALCRNTGVKNLRIKPDDVDIALALPKPRKNSSGQWCRPIPVTYTTRRGQLFIYPASMQMKSWHKAVTPMELKNIADFKVAQKKIVEGQIMRINRLTDHLKVAGTMKQNLSFPQTWISPGRETIPEAAIKEGLSLGQFLTENKGRKIQPKENDVKDEQDSNKAKTIYPWAPAKLHANPGTPETADRRSANKNNPSPHEGEPFQRNTLNRDLDPKRFGRTPYASENPMLQLSRSSLASESLSFLDINWNSSVTENDDFLLKTTSDSSQAEVDGEENGEMDNSSEWTYRSNTSSPTNVKLARAKSLAKLPPIAKRKTFRMPRDTIYRTQVNANAVCIDSVNRDYSVTPSHERSPSVNTLNTSGTTQGSSRRSRTTPRFAMSPSRTTPASTPSKKVAPSGLLETAKMLLSESSKLEGFHFTRGQSYRQLASDQLIGGGDAGASGRIESERVRAHRERKRIREATELQKQIDALDATIVRLHKRTQEKASVLHAIAHETMQQIKSICFQRGEQRRAKQMHKRRITRTLFLKHFRNRQLNRKRLRIRLGITQTTPGRPTSQTLNQQIPVTLGMKDMDESEAIRQWEAAEDLRDNAELTLAGRQENELAMKVTSRFRWLKEVTSAQLKHLEEFIRINKQTDEEEQQQQHRSEQTLEQRLPILRAKHCRLVSLLQKYGIASDDHPAAAPIGTTTAPHDSDNAIPTTIALRQLWSHLDEEKLHKLRQNAVEQFERSTCISDVGRPYSSRRLMSPTTRRRRMWRVEAKQLEEHGKELTERSFSYFDFWPVPERPTEEEDEDDDHEEKEAIENLRKLTNLPELHSFTYQGEKNLRALRKQLLQ